MMDRRDEDWPTLASDQWQQLDARYVRCMRVAHILDAVVLIALAALVVFVGPVVFDWRFGRAEPYILLGLGLLVPALLLRAWCWAPVAYRHAAWRCDAVGIEIRRGVFWRRSILVPRSRIQHTDIVEGPLLRRFGLAKLSVHTAGNEFAEVDLEGIEREVAFVLRDSLLERASERVDA